MMRAYVRTPSALYSAVLATATALALLCGCGKTSGPTKAEPAPALKKPQLVVELPDYCNTPGGMCLLADHSIIVSIPNFNNDKAPPLLMRITRVLNAADNRPDPFHKFQTPYPGLPKGYDRIAPMGIAVAPSGDLYMADLQSMKDSPQNSRLWKLHVQDQRMTLVASGFNVANGVTVYKDHVYVTETVLEPDSRPLTSAVLRFKAGEENITLKTPLKDDPHILATFKSSTDKWRFGADGIAFDSKGNLFVGLFGDGVIYKIEFEPDGKLKSNRLFAKAPAMKSCDGMHMDLRTDKLYVADSVANAVQVVAPDGRVTTLAQNGDVADKRTGELDQPCEALVRRHPVRGLEIITSNMDWPFPDFTNTKHQMPATLSVIRAE